MLKEKECRILLLLNQKAVEPSKETSSLEAAKKFGVDESNIRTWRKDSTLHCTTNSKRAKKGPKAGQFSEMEKDIREWFEVQRQNGYSVSRLAMRLQALQKAKSGKYQDTSIFTASSGWCARFLKRNGISLRQKLK